MVHPAGVETLTIHQVGLILESLRQCHASSFQFSSLVTNKFRPSYNAMYYVYLPHYKSPTALSHMHHLTCGIGSLLHSDNLILFSVLLVHLILRISPHHSHHLRSHHLSLPLHFTPDLKLISFTNPFLHSHSYSFRSDFTDLNLYWIKGALLCLF